MFNKVHEWFPGYSAWLQIAAAILSVFLLAACGSSGEVVSTAVAEADSATSMPSTIDPPPTPPVTHTSTPTPDLTGTAVAVPTATATATQTPQPTSTPAPPTFTPEPTFTPTPLIPDVLALASLDLREGPGLNYGVAGNVETNQKLEPIGQTNNCAWLEVRSPGQAVGWIANDGGSVQLNILCEKVPDGIFRPFTGLMRSTQGDGLGEIELSNQSGRDGVAVLATQDDQTAVSAFIRNGESFRMTGIRDSEYVLFFSTGSDWVGNQRRFTSGVSNQRFDDTFLFTTTGGSYTIWEVSLHPVAGGTATTTDVSDIPPP